MLLALFKRQCFSVLLEGTKERPPQKTTKPSTRILIYNRQSNFFLSSNHLSMLTAHREQAFTNAGNLDSNVTSHCYESPCFFRGNCLAFIAWRHLFHTSLILREGTTSWHHTDHLLQQETRHSHKASEPCLVSTEVSGKEEPLLGCHPSPALRNLGLLSFLYVETRQE